MGKPNATVLANIDLVRQIETATGRNTILVWVGAAGTTADGIIRPGNAWHYTFYDPTASGDGPSLHDWAVLDTGEIELRDVSPLPGLSLADISSSLQVDSDAAARLAREYGGQAYFDHFAEARIRMDARYIDGKVAWDMLLWGGFSSDGALCRIPIVIDASIGDLLDRDLECLSRLSR